MSKLPETEHKWSWHFPGDVYAKGPTSEAWPESEFRASIRRMYGVRRLPKGFECWHD